MIADASPTEVRGPMWGTLAARVARHPTLWFTAATQLLHLAPPGWWRRRPCLPIPDPAYLAFRLRTAYGTADHAISGADLVSYLRWCRDWDRRSRALRSETPFRKGSD